MVTINNEKSPDDLFFDTNFLSDSDNDSALIEDIQSERISSSITTNISSSISDEDFSMNRQRNFQDFIEEFIQENNREQFIQLAQTSGFYEIKYRKQIWPLLIDSPSNCLVQFDREKKFFFTKQNFYSADEDQIKSHRFYGQVRIDVERTLKRFPPNYSDEDRIELQEELIIVIIKILNKQNNLNYYQGYHDICLTFLLVLGADLCLPLIDSITQTHFKDFMGPTMEKTRDLLSYLMPLINSINSECAEYMQKGGVGNVMFALSWFITWYSHVLDNLDIILRLYDLFIVSHFLMPVYVAAQIVDFYAEQVLSVDCDMPSLHQYLTRLPSELDQQSWEDIIRKSIDLYNEHHPETLNQLNEQWKKKCESMENSSSETVLRRRRNQFENSSSNENVPEEIFEEHGSLPRIVLWGVTLTISGLAIYIWNHTQRMDPTSFITLGDFLAQLYGK